MASKIKAYHYTNLDAIHSMLTGSDYHKTGLIPLKRFVRIGYGKDLPKEAYEEVVEGLLSPKPLSWIKNSNFPVTWESLMHDICFKSSVALLSFDLTRKDKAYVVDRAHFERELYREEAGLGKPTTESMNEAVKKLWESRVPVFDYSQDKMNYSLPQLAIWSPISCRRLNLEWVAKTHDVWKQVLKETNRQV